METVLTIALSGLGTAELALRRKANREKDNPKAGKLLKVAATLKAAKAAVEELLSDEEFTG